MFPSKYFTIRGHERRKEAFEEKGDFPFIIWSANEQKRRLTLK